MFFLPTVLVLMIEVLVGVFVMTFFCRFRYECEGRFAGSILGKTSSNERKTFPSIKVRDIILLCEGNILMVVCSLSSFISHLANIFFPLQPFWRDLLCFLHLVAANILLAFLFVCGALSEY